MFIVSLPFAVLRGGYWAIAAMIGIAHICCYTGKILVDCLYEEVDIYEGDEVDAGQQSAAAPPRPPPPATGGGQHVNWEDGGEQPQQTTEVIKNILNIFYIPYILN